MSTRTVTGEIHNSKINIRVITDAESDVLSQNDREMDYRAKEAVKSAIRKSEICKKPVAKYDMETKTAYVEEPNGGGRRYIEK